MKSEEELIHLIERFDNTPILVVGDLVLDHYIWGKVSRISPEAPVVVVQVTEENKRPGGAGNVARNLASLGAKVFLCGVVGDDISGRELINNLDELGVDTGGILVDRSRPTTVKTRVIAHAQQVVRVDREVAKPIQEAFSEGLGATIKGRLSDVKGVIVSDYGKGTICRSLFERIGLGEKLSPFGAGKIPLLVDPKAPNFSLYRGATVIKPNRSEAEEASALEINDRKSAIAAGKVLLERWGCEMLLITLGEDGMVLVSGVGDNFTSHEIDTMAREVYDVSGAGDTVSAVFSLALAAKAPPFLAARLANIAAGIVVAEIGTVAVNLDQLRQAISSPT